MRVAMRPRLSASWLLLFCLNFAPLGRSLYAQEHIVIDAKAQTTPFPHFWEQTFGSGRAILSLRQSYRDDLRTVKQATDFQSIRFHGIFHDEVGLYDPGRQTKNPGLAAQAANDASVYNFSYVDQIYDGLLAEHVRPFVELSFLPTNIASDPAALPAFRFHSEEDGLGPGSAARLLVSPQRHAVEVLSAVWK